MTGKQFDYTNNALKTFKQMSGDYSKEQRGTLTALAASEDGLGPNYEEQVAGHSDTWSITADGLNPNGVRAPRYDVSDFATQSDFQQGFHVHWEVTANANSDDLAANSSDIYPWSFSTINSYFNLNSSGKWQDQTGQQYSANGGIFDVSPITRGASDNIVCDTWADADGIYTVVDGLLLSQCPAIVPIATSPAFFYFGGLTSVNSDLFDVRVKNYQVNLNTPNLIKDRFRVLHLGDSLTAQGGPSVNASSPTEDGIKLPWVATNTTNGCGYNGDGYAAGDTNQQQVGGFRDAGMLPTIYREFGKNGIFPWVDNLNHAQSGGTAADVLTQLSNIKANWTPDITFILIGTNDILGSVTDDATFQSNCEQIVRELYELGTALIVWATIPSPYASSLYRSGSEIDEAAAKNTIVKALPQYASDNGMGDLIKLVDLDAVFGAGAGVDKTLFLQFEECDSLAVIDGGSGYSVNDTLTVVGGSGTGAVLNVLTVDGGGAITSANFTTGSGNRGSGYTDQFTATVTGGTGSGASFTVNVGNIHFNEEGSHKAGLAMAAKALSSGGGGFEILDTLNNDTAFINIFKR